MQFNRLECRDIIANVGPGIDPDVLAKLQEGASANGVAYIQRDNSAAGELVHVSPSHAATVSAMADKSARLIEAIRNNGKPYEEMVFDDLARALEFTEEDVKAVNEERRVVFASQKLMKERKPNFNPKDAVNADFAPPDIPQGYGLDRWVGVGNKNSAGDECLRVDETNGVGLYKCSKGHAYWGNNPAVKGCTQCAATGVSSDRSEESKAADDDTSTSGRRLREDEIPGEDYF